MGQTVMGNMTVRSAIRSLLTYDGSEYLVHATSNEHQPEVRPLADNYCSIVRGSQTSHGGKLSPSFISGSICLISDDDCICVHIYIYTNACAPNFIRQFGQSFKSPYAQSPFSTTLLPQLLTLTLIISDLTGSSCTSLSDPPKQKINLSALCNTRRFKLTPIVLVGLIKLQN